MTPNRLLKFEIAHQLHETSTSQNGLQAILFRREGSDDPEKRLFSL